LSAKVRKDSRNWEKLLGKKKQINIKESERMDEQREQKGCLKKKIKKEKLCWLTFQIEIEWR
jgi:hypothetical protein